MECRWLKTILRRLRNETWPTCGSNSAPVEKGGWEKKYGGLFTYNLAIGPSYT